MANEYKRQRVGKYIIKALQSLGGSASRQAIKEEIVSDETNDITYENVFVPIKSKNGNSYIPFDLDFNFGLNDSKICGYIEDYRHNSDITLTEKGRAADANEFLNDSDREIMKKYWEKRSQEKAEKKSKSKSPEDQTDEKEIAEKDSIDNWKVEILERIKDFTPKKFESFSRLLFSKMGIKFHGEKGIKMSGDHGIDGYGYFESDEFRTSKVVVQCKRFTDAPVSEPDIDKFKGVMMSFNADYGIFVTTSHFTKQAQEKAVQGGNTVTLIDGQRLVELIEKYKLHITPVVTYELNDYYYQKD